MRADAHHGGRPRSSHCAVRPAGHRAPGAKLGASTLPTLLRRSALAGVGLLLARSGRCCSPRRPRPRTADHHRRGRLAEGAADRRRRLGHLRQRGLLVRLPRGGHQRQRDLDSGPVGLLRARSPRTPTRSRSPSRAPTPTGWPGQPYEARSCCPAPPEALAGHVRPGGGHAQAQRRHVVAEARGLATGGTGTRRSADSRWLRQPGRLAGRGRRRPAAGHRPARAAGQSPGPRPSRRRRRQRAPAHWPSRSPGRSSAARPPPAATACRAAPAAVLAAGVASLLVRRAARRARHRAAGAARDVRGGEGAFRPRAGRRPSPDPPRRRAPRHARAASSVLLLRSPSVPGTPDRRRSPRGKRRLIRRGAAVRSPHRLHGARRRAGTAPTFAGAHALLPRIVRGRQVHRRWRSLASLRAHGHPRPRPRGADDRAVSRHVPQRRSAQRGGTVEKVDVWGRRRLAYEIDKKAEGIYAVIDLHAEPDTVKELDRQLNLNESILRTKVMRPELRAARPPSGAVRAGAAPLRTPLRHRPGLDARFPTVAQRRGPAPHPRTRGTRARGVPTWQARPSSPSSATSPPTPSCASPRPGRPSPASRRVHPPHLRQEHQRVEGRRGAVPALLRLAAGGGERRRVAAARHAVDRPGPAEAALLRDEGGREAHRHRARRRRGRPLAALRHREGHQGLARRRRRAAAATAAASRRRLLRRRRAAAARPTTRGPARRRAAAAAPAAGPVAAGATTPGAPPVSAARRAPVLRFLARA